ncbi:MAG: hypothetical protein ACKVS6_13725 [Planctomycetota bacterium]
MLGPTGRTAGAGLKLERAWWIHLRVLAIKQFRWSTLPAHVRWNQLRLALLVGAIYDIAVGLSIAVALQLLSPILQIPYPAEPIYARLCGVLMMGLGLLYGAAALTIPYSMTSVFVAIWIRTAGGIFLLVAPFFDTNVSRFMAVFGAIDLFFAIWTFVALRIAKRKL